MRTWHGKNANVYRWRGAAFFWAVRSGQYDDLESPEWNIILNEDHAPPDVSAGNILFDDDRAPPAVSSGNIDSEDSRIAQNTRKPVN